MVWWKNDDIKKTIKKPKGFSSDDLIDLKIGKNVSAATKEIEKISKTKNPVKKRKRLYKLANKLPGKETAIIDKIYNALPENGGHLEDFIKLIDENFKPDKTLLKTITIGFTLITTIIGLIWGGEEAGITTTSIFIEAKVSPEVSQSICLPCRPEIIYKDRVIYKNNNIIKYKDPLTHIPTIYMKWDGIRFHIRIAIKFEKIKEEYIYNQRKYELLLDFIQTKSYTELQSFSFQANLKIYVEELYGKFNNTIKQVIIEDFFVEKT